MDKLLLYRVRPSFSLLKRGMCTPQSGTSQSEGSRNISPRYKPTELQKFILVWTKKYKSKAEIPTEVSYDLIERSKSQARIKLSNYLIFLTILASCYAVFSGKAAAKRGESVHQMNLDWHKKYREEFESKQGAETK